MTVEHPVCTLPLQKFWEISRQIHEFMTWTQVECPFEKDKKIQSYLLTAPIYSEEGEAASASSRALPLVQVSLGVGLVFIPMLHKGAQPTGVSAWGWVMGR